MPISSGKIPNSLHYTPCGQYLVYPLGCLVVVKNLKTEKEAFLDGHTHEISCVKISHDGRTAASGQINNMGVKVGVFIEIIL
jgi:WD40 repeat protein